MLVLSRKTRQQILIADDIEVTVLGINGNRVRLGFNCPPGVKIVRSELADRELAAPNQPRHGHWPTPHATTR